MPACTPPARWPTPTSRSRRSISTWCGGWPGCCGRTCACAGSRGRRTGSTRGSRRYGGGTRTGWWTTRQPRTRAEGGASAAAPAAASAEAEAATTEAESAEAATATTEPEDVAPVAETDDAPGPVAVEAADAEDAEDEAAEGGTLAEALDAAPSDQDEDPAGKA